MTSTAGRTAFLVGLALFPASAQAETVLKPGVRLWVDPHSSTAQVPRRRRPAAGGDPERDLAHRRASARRCASRHVDGGPARRGPGDRRLQHPRPRLRAVLGGRGRKREEPIARGSTSSRRGIGNRRAVVILEPDALAGGCTRTRDHQERRRAAAHAHAHRGLRRRRPQPLAAGGDDGHAAAARRDRARRRLRPQRLQLPHQPRADRLRHHDRQARQEAVRDRHEPQRPGPSSAGTQEWCNPPGRGLGERPTTTTNIPRLDAKLWIKTPGESDGECERRDQPPAAGSRGRRRS